MSEVKSLAKDTAIYGMSSIIGRFLNWCLVPLYTGLFAAEEYGVVTYVYSVVALALIILTYGMETGFFRFSNHERWKDPREVYSTSLISLGVSSSAFIILVLLFLKPITVWMECDGHPSYVWMMAVCVAIDAFTAIPFSYLRNTKRPMRFALLKLVNIGLNIGFNLFFLLLCPWLESRWAGSVSWFYNPSYGIGYIFLSNLIASVVMMLLMTSELRGFAWRFNSRLWREMLAYSAPLLVLGIAGVMNQTIDKILYPSLVADKAQALEGLGIYGANYKIAIVMVMFIQAFRFAYEPFIFAKNKEAGGDRTKSYCDAMKYFIIAGLMIFMGVMFYLDIVKHLISPRYYSGLQVVPIIMLAELFFGIFFNLSLWYKLTDRTIWGMWFSLFGLAITLAGNAVLVPRMGYMGCAWAAFACYGSMMVVSYVIGRAKYPLPYELRRIGMYFLVAAALYVLGQYVLVTGSIIVDYFVRAVLLAVYALLVMKVEHISISSLTAPVLRIIRR